MEIGDSVLSMRELVSSNPGGWVVRIFVALPSDQITKSAFEAVVESGI